ncbi:rubredoxin [Aquimarina sp. U1-2]|uniref:rubredoxin n=1 Tax=Aquimarina sp. U1-2 TaxID=2823141 RepID=UPI001AECB107|nr:rubredoxin [Aquimarina sp. U1-2]MBP2833620.1 rubredoxin [Aquimarina sp. U1-2]
MKNTETLHRIDIKGGVLSVMQMLRIIEYAKELDLQAFNLGSRQDILFSSNDSNGNSISSKKKFEPSFFSSDSYENITCSYVSVDIFDSTVWLRGTTYLYILEDFQYQPELKINIVDPKQQIVPLFSGDLNFIASPHEDYWYIFLRLPGWEEAYYPVLVYTWDIAKIAQAIEVNYNKVGDLDDLFTYINIHFDTNNKTITTPLHIDFKPFPYYEGMNKMENNQYWLGLYWRNNHYNLDFLKALCEYCLYYKIGKICLTPWKSIIIKAIPNEGKLTLEKLLGRFGINIRHSALELNWHLPIKDQKALELKKCLVVDFNANDISTYGLTFAIVSLKTKNNYFTSIVIEKNEASATRKEFMPGATFNVVHAKNFDPNTRNYIMYAQDVDSKNLSMLLLELTKTYFKNLGEPQEQTISIISTQEEIEVHEVYQCNDCLTIYDPTVGDAINMIVSGTSFNNLPDTYRCSLCDSPMTNFKKTMIEKI